MSSRNLPPVKHLPQWPRVGFLDNPCVPRPPVGIHLRPMPVAPRPSRAGVDLVSPHGDMDIDTRVASLQKNIQFLQQQHKETLENLHAEIDVLRRENKELQYKLIMAPPKSSRTTSQSGSAPLHQTRNKFPMSQRGIRQPSQGSEDDDKGTQLEQPLQDTRPLQDQTLSSTELLLSSGMLGSSCQQEYSPEVRGGLITSLKPLRIHSSPAHPPRAPTLKECELIIRQLYNTNSMQSEEILRVKAVLRDIVFNKKITPENYIMTKAFLADSSCKSSEAERLPQITLSSLPKKIFGPPNPQVTSGVILPSLKQSLNPTVAERQRRTQALQRNRLKRAVQ